MVIVNLSILDFRGWKKVALQYACTSYMCTKKCLVIRYGEGNVELANVAIIYHQELIHKYYVLLLSQMIVLSPMAVTEI